MFQVEGSRGVDQMAYEHQILGLLSENPANQERYPTCASKHERQVTSQQEKTDKKRTRTSIKLHPFRV